MDCTVLFWISVQSGGLPELVAPAQCGSCDRKLFAQVQLVFQLFPFLDQEILLTIICVYVTLWVD